MTSKEKAILAAEALEEKKGGDVRIIEIGEISTIADYFVIADGANAPQVEALVDNVKDKLGRAGVDTRRTEGMRNCGWILIDYDDVVVHVFSKSDRLFYDLERVWRDGKQTSISELKGTEA
ncbi:MAG: ribosome silencing factor [Lachnospiraceae bacterium]|nr:ribosome silencing factor [Lachnospiraceae bacterium]